MNNLLRDHELLEMETINNLIRCLDWYVANDDVNTQEGNEFWLDGYNEAANLLNVIFKENIHEIKEL